MTGHAVWICRFANHARTEEIDEPVRNIFNSKNLVLIRKGVVFYATLSQEFFLNIDPDPDYVLMFVLL